ncbi:MAG: GNAT family N-acetyltransferase [Cognatishimia sp.]
MTWTIATTDDLLAVHDLRHAVFVIEQGFSEEDEWDGQDDHAIQTLAKVDGEPVGTARILISDGVGKIGRLCVLKPHRGRGLGVALVQFSIAHLRQTSGVGRIVLGAQQYAIGFYEKLGFQLCGPVYDDGGVPHRAMEIVL